MSHVAHNNTATEPGMKFKYILSQELKQGLGQGQDERRIQCCTMRYATLNKSLQLPDVVHPTCMA